MGKRRPQGLEATEVCWGQRAGTVLTPKVAAGPHRTVAAWSWPQASPGRVEWSRSLGFRFLGCCCCPSSPTPGHGGERPPVSAYRPAAG